MSKTELIVEVNFYGHNKVALKDCIEQLQKEIREIRGELNDIRRKRNCRYRFMERAVETEKRLAEQEQYSRRECVELVGLSEEIHGEDLEAGALNAFDVARIKLEKRDFHAIHRLRNNKVVITKLVNRRDALAILRNKKKLRELHDKDKQKLRSNKIYITKILCPAFRQLLGKFNSLHKLKKLNSFYTIKIKIKIRFGRENEEVNTEINHEADLVDVFGPELISSINRERKRENAQKKIFFFR